MQDKSINEFTSSYPYLLRISLLSVVVHKSSEPSGNVNIMSAICENKSSMKSDYLKLISDADLQSILSSHLPTYTRSSVK